jgi:glycosyltransferase involved in cell wall biosynthesis
LDVSLSVVIPAFQAGATIRTAVESVRACRGAEHAQILVIDDGSTDDTAAQASGPGVEVLRLPHVGRAAALNDGIKAASGDVLLFTDADCVVPPDWIETTLAELAGWDGVGGNLVPSRWTVVEQAKILRYVHEFEREAVLEGRYRGVCLNGNNMALKRQALLAVVGFDEKFLHGADADLTRRLLAGGFRLRRTVRTRVMHRKTDTLGSFLRTMWRRGSTIRFGMKNFEEDGWTLLRALVFSPLKWLAVDLFRVRRLMALDAAAHELRAWLAPWVNLLGGWATGLGRVYYYLKFRRELR